MHIKHKVIANLHEIKAFAQFVIHNFIAHDCTYRASALAFVTLMATIPLMTVALAILSSFPIFQNLKDPLQEFIFQNFVPSSGKAIQIYLQHFIEQVSKASLLGVAFLLITTFLLLITIEQAMNTIWRVSAERGNIAAFLLYWAILSLAPVLLGLSLAASSCLSSFPLLLHKQLHSLLFPGTPYALSFVGFTLLYIIVPNHPVKIRHGICGALVATILFEALKLAFSNYLTRYNPYELLYGAFASVPIFFVWIFWVWMITLLGAEVSYALSVKSSQRSGNPLPGFVHVLLWLQQLWIAQHKNRGLTLDELIESSDQPYNTDPRTIINLLTKLELIHLDAKHQYRLSKNLGTINLYELAHQLPYRLPNSDDISQLPLKTVALWQPIFDQQNQAIQKIPPIKIEQLFTFSH